MALIAVGGMQHETNVFAPSRATFDKFEMADEWPPLCRGDAMLEAIAGINLPAEGAVEWLRAAGHEILPLLWCSATPSAQVSEDAFERIVAMLLEPLARAPRVDGVVLDLHGAMVCEHLGDGDGEILRRVRAAVGAAVPVVATLDLHANVSRQMVEQASVLEIYRTYPHVDMAETGARAAGHVDRLLRRGLGRYPAEAFRRPDFLIPPVSGCTLAGPAAEVYARLGDLVDGEVAGLSLACGFPAADVADAAPALVTYGFETRAVDAAADDLLGEIERREDAFRGRLYDVDDGVREALRLAAEVSGPVMLADSQDNPGGGGLGDTTEILRELVTRRAPGAVVGVLNDADAARAAHAAGLGARLELALGGRNGVPGCRQFAAEYRVLALSDGRFDASGPMLRGAHIDLGASALLETGGVKIVVGSKAVQTMDQAMFRHLGVEPAQQRIIAVKSSIHFRNDFQAIAGAILMIAAPGPVISNPAALPLTDPELRRLAHKHAYLTEPAT